MRLTLPLIGLTAFLSACASQDTASREVIQAPAIAPPAPAPAQEPAPAPDQTPTLPPAAARPELADRLLDLGLADRRAYRMLQELIAAAPKRLSGSPGNAAAVDWAERTMHQIGLQNVRREPVMAPHWERGEPERVMMLSEGQGALELSACALGGSPAGNVTAPVMRLEGLAALQAAGGSVRGKIVFLDQAMDPRARTTFQAYGDAAGQRTQGPALAARQGAVGFVMRSLSTADDDAPHTGATRFEEGAPQIPALALGVLSARRLASELDGGGSVTLTLETHCRQLPDAPAWNVLGEIPGGAHPDEVVLLGGHLDAWETGSGAQDDGAGCCHALEAARLLLAAGVRPQRTVRVVLFANEENGLAGGRAYAEAHGGEHHWVALESDSGGFTPRGIRLGVSAAVLDGLEPAGEALEAVHAGGVQAEGGGADVGPLRDHGAVVGSLEVDDTLYFDYHHSRRDVLEAVSPRPLELGAVVLAYWAAVLADLEPPAAAGPAPASPAGSTPGSRSYN